MKTPALLLSLVLISTQAHAGFFENLGNAAGDLVTLGNAGAQRDREFAQKQAELAAQARAQMIADRDAEIGHLTLSIQKLQSDITQAAQINASQDQMYASLKSISDAFAQQLSGETTVKLRLEGAQNTVNELGQDLLAVQFVLSQLSNPEISNSVLDILQKIASSRQLSAADFITRTLEQAQNNKDTLKKTTMQISQLVTSYPTVLASQAQFLSAKQEELATATARLNSLNASIAQEAAEAEAARVRQAQLDQANAAAQQAWLARSSQELIDHNPRAK